MITVRCSMPANAKPVEDRQRRNVLATLGDMSAADVPEPPRGLPASWRRRWVDLWRSPIASILDPVSDAPAIARLFELRMLEDKLARLVTADSRIESAERRNLVRLRRAAEVGPVDSLEVESALEVATCTRRLMLATIGARVRVATEIRMLESQLGLSPRSRLSLGVMLMAGRKAARAASLDGAIDAANELD